MASAADDIARTAARAELEATEQSARTAAKNSADEAAKATAGAAGDRKTIARLVEENAALQKQIADFQLKPGALRETRSALEDGTKVSDDSIKAGNEALEQMPADTKKTMQEALDAQPANSTARSKLMKAGLYSMGGLAFLMVMYKTSNPFKAIKDATGDVSDVVKDTGKGLRTIKDFVKGLVKFFTSGWGLAIIGVVVGLILLMMFMH
jgi:hypothetical protein